MPNTDRLTVVVSNAVDGDLATFSLTSDGALAPLARYPAGDVAMPVAVQPDRGRLYAAAPPAAVAWAARPRLGGWHDLAHDAAHRAALACVSPWAADHLGTLLDLEESASLVGETLLHGDLYPFNVLLTPAAVHVVDWPHAWVGPAYADVLTLLSTAVLNGLDPEPYVTANPLTRDLPASTINAFLSVHAAFLLRLAVTAGSSADPNLIGMATALGNASLRWLAARR